MEAVAAEPPEWLVVARQLLPGGLVSRRLVRRPAAANYARRLAAIGYDVDVFRLDREAAEACGARERCWGLSLAFGLRPRLSRRPIGAG